MHSLVAGGAAVLPLGRADGNVDLRYADTLLGDRIRRFSCGLRWYPTRRLGLALNGDNWMRDLGGTSLHAYAWFAGIALR